MRKPCGKRERTRFAEDGRNHHSHGGNLAVFLGGSSALRGAVDGLGCREDLQEDQLLALHDRLFNRAVVGRFGKQAAVMEIEGGCGRRPRTGEPFAAERVAVLDEGRDAAEGGPRRCSGRTGAALV